MLAASLPSSSLISNTDNGLSVPRVKTNTGARAFHSCAPSLWNNLPLSVCSAISLATFNKHLKTHLLTWPFPHRHQHAQWPVDITELFLQFCCWTLIRLSCHWAWLRRGYRCYTNLIDWLIELHETYPVLIEWSHILVVSMDQFPMSFTFPILPCSDVLCACFCIGVHTLAVSYMVLPFTIICVAVDIEILANTTPLVLNPATYEHIFFFYKTEFSVFVPFHTMLCSTVYKIYVSWDAIFSCSTLTAVLFKARYMYGKL